MFSDAGGSLLKIDPSLRQLTTFLFVTLGPWMIKLGGGWDLPENLEKDPVLWIECEMFPHLGVLFWKVVEHFEGSGLVLIAAESSAS